jgi:glyceraldehyde 3-phosphate dehydrogenase
MRIAINGMGRIGRLLFRRLVGHPLIELVAVNDVMPAANLAYLVKYDSVYGTFASEIDVSSSMLTVNGSKVMVLQQEDPLTLPWQKLSIDVVLECSGKFTNAQTASYHLKAGAKKVLLSTTGSDDIPLMIYGFNHTALAEGINIISPGGCMTNCTVQVLNVLGSTGFASAQINVLHSYTSRQEVVDAPNKNFRRGRAAAESIIPVEIDLHQSLERLMPALKNKIAALSTRVPVANGALADFTIQLNNSYTVSAINTLFKNAAETTFKGIIDYTEEPVVSMDIKGNTHSCIIDGSLTSIAGNQLKLIVWFDNEYGFTSRMIDWLLFWR